MSGGFRCLIAPIAAQLNIPSENVYANKLKFYFTGKYVFVKISGLYIVFCFSHVHVKYNMRVCVTCVAGEYAGFDETQPTCRSGGKGEVIRRLKEERKFKTVVHIGDGSTDLEASPPADAFIGAQGIRLRIFLKAVRGQCYKTVGFSTLKQ